MTTHADGAAGFIATGARRISAKPTAHRTDTTARNANGNPMPPKAYSQPPIDGPISSATLVPDIT